MSYVDALNILDLRREGADMPQSVVDAALKLTGDLADYAWEHMAHQPIEVSMAGHA